MLWPLHTHIHTCDGSQRNMFFWDTLIYNLIRADVQWEDATEDFLVWKNLLF